VTTVAVIGAKELADRLGADISIEGVVSAVFDDATDTWLLRTRSGDEHRADIVVDAERTFHVPRKAPSANDIATFDTTKPKRRWRPRRQRARPQVVKAPACAIADDIPGDALVGSRGLTIQHAWHAGAAAYLGIAVHDFPNYFMLLGPDSPVGPKEAVIDRQFGYITECLNLMRRKESAHIEVRRSVQQQYAQRGRVKPVALAFDLAPDQEHEIYDGPATLTVGGDEHAVRVRLTGHLDPIDGKYHWQGMVFGTAAELPKQPVTLSTDALTAQARITEQTPWGSYSIAGVGSPPFQRN
jgi:hypothetical protein